MLGVLKRRLKPKRAKEEKENKKGRKNVHNKSETVVPVDVARITPSQRQIHPLFEEKTQLLAYDDCSTTPTPILKRFHDDPLPKKSLSEPVPSSSCLNFLTPTTLGSTLHLVPNICVEEGRIEFMKSPSEGSNVASLNPPRDDKKIKSECLSQSAAVPETKRVEGWTRAQQTQTDFLEKGSSEENFDLVKECLEAKVRELQRLLECEQEVIQKERLAVTRLQRQLARRDATQRDVDRERRLRADTESRLRETVSESERYRESLAGLQREFSKMEDTVRSMLQYKTRYELLSQEKVFLTAIYESRVVQYQSTITKLEQENESLKQRLRLFENIETEDVSSELLKRLKSLETENASLFQDADFQRKQYEKCLDDIANQVVRALLSQKGLREEIGNLQAKIKELENQNHVLADVLVNRSNKGFLFALPSTDCDANNVCEKNSSDVFFKKAYTQETCSSTKFNSNFGENKCLHFSDIGDKNILESLSSFESLIVVPLQRPRSLSLQLHTTPVALSATTSVMSKRCQNKKGKLNLVTLNKKPSEDEGNESPESGNRDEGYSTMSSDVQGLGETNELSKRELEDLKEASDETDVITDSNGEMTSAVVIEDVSDPDMFFIPLNLSVTINSRQSYPPCKSFLPLQNMMRSFSDSHLCLKLTASSAVSPPVSPSLFFMEKNTSSFSIKQKVEKDEESSQCSTISWCSGNWWDSKLFQHWLKLDDTRIKQQQQRDMLQLHYDRTEIEEWSMSLSCDDIAKLAENESSCHCNLHETSEAVPIMKQIKSSSDESSNRWSTYNSLNLTVSTKTDDEGKWACEESDSKKQSWQVISPIESWCSTNTNNSEDCCRTLTDCYFNDCDETEPKNIVGVHNDSEESITIDTDFTRDFYRLVKYESTKSLASNCSKSNCQCELELTHQKQSEFAQDREMALQSVLNFIVEQQKYCHKREEKDLESQSYCTYGSIEDRNDENYFCDNNIKIEENNEVSTCVEHQKQAQVHSDGCDLNLGVSENDNTPNNVMKKNILVKNKNSCDSNFLSEPTYKKSSENINHFSPKKEIATKLPVRNSKNKNVIKHCIKKDNIKTATNTPTGLKSIKSNFVSQIKKQNNKTSHHNSEHLENFNLKGGKPRNLPSSGITFEVLTMQSEKSTSKISCMDSQSRIRQTCIPVSTSKKQSHTSYFNQTLNNKVFGLKTDSKLRGTKIPVISYKKSEPAVIKTSENIDLVSPKSNSSSKRNGDVNFESSKECGNNSSRPTIIETKPLESPASKVALFENSSFHEKTSSKDVINELNKIIRKKEEATPNNGDENIKPLDMACCCPTGWVHVERDIDFTDPKARANLLDVMLVSSNSSLGSGSSSDSGGDEPVAYNHLYRLHRFQRHKKVSNRSTSHKSPVDQELLSPEIDICTPITPTTPLTSSDDSDERTGGPVSFSDSCVESYPDSVESLEEQQ